jgi:hypothetical protein
VVASAQRIVNVMRQTISQETGDGATYSYHPAIISAGAGAYIASAYIAGDTDLVTGIRQQAGAYVSPGDYVIVGMSRDGDAWVEQVLPYSMYSRIALDYSNGVVYTGDGNSAPTNAIISTGGVMKATGVISATVSADTNNWNPTGLSTANVIRVDSNNYTITGIVAQEPGRIITIYNVGTGNLYISHDSASSSAANRILTVNGDSGRIDNDGVAHIWYDGTSSRWRLDNFPYNIGEVGDMAAALAFSGSNSAGTNALEWAAIDHSHAMPANPLTAHEAILTTQGDMPYATAASTWTRLPKGTAYQTLRMNSGATAPEWGNPWYAHVSYGGAGFQLSNSTDTALSFDTEEYDATGMHSTTTTGSPRIDSRFTVPVTGYYMVNMDVTFTGNATGRRIATIFASSGSRHWESRNYPGDTAAGRVAVGGLCYITANDYVYMSALQGSGGNLNVTGANASIYWVGP